jgi:hypothetical protein
VIDLMEMIETWLLPSGVYDARVCCTVAGNPATTWSDVHLVVENNTCYILDPQTVVYATRSAVLTHLLIKISDGRTGAGKLTHPTAVLSRDVVTLTWSA